MKKLQVTIAALIIVVGLVFVVFNKSSEKGTESNTSIATTNVAYAQNYKEYSPEALEKELADGKKVAVFYSSKTCGSCKALDTSITEEVANIPSDTVILKADWRTYSKEAKTHGITSYHTLRFYDNGPERNQSGLFTLDSVLSSME